MQEEVYSEEQGFFAEDLEIKYPSPRYPKQSQLISNQSLHFSNNIVETYCLRNYIIPKKQPKLAYNTLTNQTIQSSNQIKNKSQHKKHEKTNKIQKKRTKLHPYFTYAINEDYQLIYVRNQGKQLPIKNDDIQYIKNQVVLNHVGNITKNNYCKKIKTIEPQGTYYSKQVKNISRNLKTQNLIFDSRFECGNLHCVYKLKSKQEYVLFTQNDTNTLGYNQWFYFSIRNAQAGVCYTFKIVNFKKKHSFFRSGSKPVIYSQKNAYKNGNGWSKVVSNVHYDESPVQLSSNCKLYCLQFDIVPEHINDYILVAMSLPYSYTRLTNFISEMKQYIQQRNLKQDNNQQKFLIDFEINSIARSICGNFVPEITITSSQKQSNQIDKNKKMIIIMARQHPGQVWSSYMMEGMIKSLIFFNSQPDHQEWGRWLLRNYIFKIYPMINVDGVIYGNSRCDITGSDLNRQWKEPLQLLFPQVYKIKKAIQAYKKNYQIDLCLDLHGHSKNYNIFSYGCRDNVYTCRILPYLINKANPIFYMPSCTFGITRYKSTTARAALYDLIKNENVLTIETSYFGSKLINNQTEQFTPKIIFKVASDLLKAIQSFLNRSKETYSEVMVEIKNNINQYLKYDQVNEQDEGSDSDPEVDVIDIKKKLKEIFDSNCVTLDSVRGLKRYKKNDSDKLQVKLQEIKRPRQKKVQNKNRYSIMNLSNDSISNKIKSRTIEPQRYQVDNSFGSKQLNSKLDDSRERYSSNYNQTNFHKGQMNQSNKIFRGHNRFTINYEKLAKSDRKSNENMQLIEKLHMTLNEHHQQKPKPVRKSYLFQKAEKPQVIQDRIEDVRRSDEFVRKFSRFIPISMNNRYKSNADIFDNKVYNEDQSGLISILFENKKKIDLEKIRRDVKESTKIVERQGKLKLNRQEAGLDKIENIIDFKTFKQNEKINKQIKKIARIKHNRYSEHL